MYDGVESYKLSVIWLGWAGWLRYDTRAAEITTSGTIQKLTYTLVVLSSLESFLFHHFPQSIDVI